MSGGFADCGVVGVLHIETAQGRLSRIGHREESLREAFQPMAVVDHCQVFSDLRHPFSLVVLFMAMIVIMIMLLLRMAVV